MAWRFPLRLLPVTAKIVHFLLRPGSAIVHLAVPLAMAKAVGLVACRRPAREKGFGQAAVPDSFAPRSWPGLGRFFSAAGPSDSQTCLVPADSGTAAGLSVAARPDLVVAAAAAFVAVAGSFVAVFVGLVGLVGLVAGPASDPVCFVCPACLFAAAKGKEKAALVFYFLALRSSSLRNRNSLSPPCFADRA